MSFNFKDFIVNNKWPLLFGIVAFGMFLFFTISGNRICDCVSTEKYSSNTSRGHLGVARFNHK